MRGIPRLHVITPPDQADCSVEIVRVAVEAGAPLVQFRVKDVSDRVRLDHARRIVGVCHAAGAVVTVNDRADVAAASGADGVHVGADDLSPDAARGILGRGAIVGATARNPEAARIARDAGADYLGVGPVYRTSTKSGLPDPIGLAGLEAVVRSVDLPVIAIAGVHPGRVPELLDAGAWGVAAVGAVFAAPDPTAAVREFLEMLR